MIRSTCVIFSFCLFLAACQESRDQQADDNLLFSLIESDLTGVSFVNRVEDQKDFNILNYRNFYNGGGVALGDINNDGYEDIYFTSNLEANRLYLNNGDWTFQDITESAGVVGERAWSTGVSMSDVNNDGLLDIYVCNSGIVGGDDRKNELFINNGDLTFSEQAAIWGLDSEAFSVHASFFDYDLDGDLDCYLLNNSFLTPEKMLQISKDPKRDKGSLGGDRLMQNQGDIFQDVSEEAGIHTGDIGFALGVSVSDLNNDMLPDIYISNDFWERDYLYINQGDGTFIDLIETMITKTSLNSMGADIADINNDGFPDIMTTDMLPTDNYRLKTMTQFEPFRMEAMDFDTLYHQQFMHNNLQLNVQGRYFNEIAGMAGVTASDWSWGALILDLDLDGWKDVFISNGIRKDMTDFDFVDIITNRKVVDQIVADRGEFDFRDFIPFLPETKISNSVFINQRGLNFNENAMGLGLGHRSFSNGSAYGDLDNDGDLDLVVNNANMECFLYRNNSVEQKTNNYLKIQFSGTTKNPLGIGAKVIISEGAHKQSLQHFLARGFQSSVAPGLTFGLSGVDILDSMSIIWPDGKMQILTSIQANQTIELEYENANNDWEPSGSLSTTLFNPVNSNELDQNTRHQENDFNDFALDRLSYKMMSKEGPRILKADFNNDGLEDMFLLGAADDPNKLLFQNARGDFVLKITRAFNIDKHLEATCGAVIDFDNDGDQDVLVGHGGNEINKGQQNFGTRLYQNNGNGNFTLNISSTPQVGGNLSCIEPCDFDKDGNIDLFLGARVVPGNYGLVPSSFLLRNNGQGAWQNLTTREIGTLGMVTGAKWSDIDQDGDDDLVVVGDWMPITIFENTPGVLKRKGVIKDSYGWWSAMEVKDLDQDGDDDFILGNWGLNSKFRASLEKPLKLYVKDFDKNGKADQILEWYPPAEEQPFPFAPKDDLVKAIPSINKKLENYRQYGQSTYTDLFVEEQRKGALEFKCNQLQSAILWRDSTGFRLEPLPFSAQTTAVFAIVAEDIDQDKVPDLLLFGNLFGLKPEVGRMDINHGIYLKGLEHGGFEAISPVETGLFVNGQVRDAVFILDPDGSKKLVLARNDQPVQVFELRK